MARRSFAVVGVSGEDTVLNLVINSAPLVSRIADQLAQRGLVPLSANVDRGISGLSSYAFVYKAELASYDQTRTWSDNALRSAAGDSVQAATTYTPTSVSIISRGDVGPAAPEGLDPSLPGQIVTKALTSVRKIIEGIGTTGQILVVAVGVLVVGAVVLILIRPQEARRAIVGGR